MDTLTLIPARGGSKGIPRKNIADLGGRPLLDWTVRAALDAGLVPLVSTEDREIADVAGECGAKVVARPDYLASDTATTQQVVDYHLRQWDANLVCVLHPTSPFRTADDIRACLTMLERDDCGAVVSISEPDRHPWLMVQRSHDGRIQWRGGASFRLPPRQHFPDAYAVNGAIYCATREAYIAQGGFMGRSTWGYAMPRERSMDIDEPWDLEVARAIVERGAVEVAA